jgi:hypothetical protein
MTGVLVEKVALLDRREFAIRRTETMRDRLVGIMVLAAVLASSSLAMAQAGLNNNMYNKLKESGPGGPAPKRDFTGSWAGPLVAQKGDDPSLTPEGQKLFSMNKPEAKFHVAGTNDAFVRTCDPLGFPRNIIFEIRGLSFATMPDRVIILNQYQQAWREIWTDGRELPKNVGGTTKDAPDPRYYGYSVGHWEGDNTFVVDTTGLDDKTWLNGAGYPHSIEAHVQERYTRPDHNDLQVSVTVDDPKLYTKPFVLASASFRWLPSQELEEQLCIPSQMQEYLQLVGDPGGSGVPAGK